MTTIYFHVVAKYLDLVLSGSYLVEQCKTVWKVFGECFCNNKNQILIIKLLKGKFLQKKLVKS